MMRRASAEETLPSLSSVIAVPGTTPGQVKDIQHRFNALNFSPSPDPSSARTYTREQPHAHQQSPDGAAYHQRALQQLAGPRGSWGVGQRGPLVTRGLSLAPREQERMYYPPPNQARRASLDPRFITSARSPDPLRQTHHGGIRKKSNQGHNNKRYTVEQMDYIRYLKHDIGIDWKAVEIKFGEAFPWEEKARPTQGVQGVYYRQNDFVPALDLATNAIIYLPNGHMKGIKKKVREQTKEADKTIYGLVNLWPEVALTYEWVRDEDRKKAAKMGECLR